MKIFNRNSKFNISASQIDFFDDIIRYGESQNIIGSILSISVLLDEVPVFLYSGEEPTPTIEAIYINPEKIFESSPANNLTEKNLLLAYTLIKEYAIIMLSRDDPYYYIEINSNLFIKYLNESIVNLFVLNIFENLSVFFSHITIKNKNIKTTIEGYEEFTDKNTTEMFEFVRQIINQNNNGKIALALFDALGNNEEIYYFILAYYSKRRHGSNMKLLMRHQKWLDYINNQNGIFEDKNELLKITRKALLNE